MRSFVSDLLRNAVFISQTEVWVFVCAIVCLCRQKMRLRGLAHEVCFLKFKRFVEELKPLTGSWVVKAQKMRVQGLTMQMSEQTVQRLKRSTPKQVRADFPQAAIRAVADNRIAGKRAVNTDLVGPACLQNRFGPAKLRQML